MEYRSGKMTSNNSLIALDGGGGDIIVGTGTNLVRLSSTSAAAISASALLPTDAPFQVDFGGAVTASAGLIAGFIIEEGALSSSTSTLIIDSQLDNGRGAIMAGSAIQNHPSSSTPTAADDKIFLMNHNAEVLVVSSSSGEILNSAKMGEEYDDQTRSSIALSKGQLFVRTNKKLYCIE